MNQMIARLTSKAIFLGLAVGMAFFGVGLLGVALAKVLIAMLGAAGAYGVAGAVLVIPPVIWAIALRVSKPKPPPSPPPSSEITRVLMAAVTKETPWIAIVGAVLAGAAKMFLNRHKTPK